MHQSANPDKVRLEADKLSLEVRKLRFDVSPTGRSLQLLSSLGSLIAVLALSWTVISGNRQYDADRMERASAKLGQSSASERAIGVAQLASFLPTNDREEDRRILVALVSHERSEVDPAIRNRIENVFGNLSNRLDKTVLNSTLEYVVGVENELEKSSRLSQFELAEAYADRHGHYMIPAEFSGVQSADSSQQQSFEQLQGLKALMMNLLKAGARWQNMGGLFCPGCDFTELKADLSGVNFSHAILTSTNWSSMELEHVDFSGARIEGAYFLGAHLKGAIFGRDAIDGSQDEYAVLRTLKLKADRAVPGYALQPATLADEILPQLFCADLTDAVLPNFIFGVVTEGFQANSHYWPLIGANIAGADLGSSSGKKFNTLVIEKLKPNEKTLSGIRLLQAPGEENRYGAYIASTDTSSSQLGVSDSQDELIRGVLSSVATTLLSAKNADKAKIPENLDLTTFGKPQIYADCNTLIQANVNAKALTTKQ